MKTATADPACEHVRQDVTPRAGVRHAGELARQPAAARAAQIPGTPPAGHGLRRLERLGAHDR
jgi:hypothetical protein